jgi:hypothetical protein
MEVKTRNGGYRMKKNTSLVFILALFLISFGACGPKEEAGSPAVDEMLKMFPVDAKGVFFVDVDKGMATEMAGKIIQDEAQKMGEFIEKTGIDPEKDVHHVAAAFIPVSPNNHEGLVIINLEYDKEKILSMIQEQSKGELMTEDYEGITIYFTDKRKTECLVMLDESHIGAGNAVAAKSCIDVIQGRKDDIHNNEALSALLGRTDKSTIVWAAIVDPAEAMNMPTSQSPQLKIAESFNALTMNFDYKSKSVLVDIKAESEDVEKNHQLAQTLNGFKALGATMTADKPELGELLNAVQITSGDDHVMISANIPEELAQKLKNMVDVTPEKK